MLEGCKNNFTPFDQPVMSAGYLRHLPTTITISKSSIEKKQKQKKKKHHTSHQPPPCQAANGDALEFTLPKYANLLRQCHVHFQGGKKLDEANGHQSITWIQHISLDKKWINHDQTIYTIQLPPREIRYPTNGKWTCSSQLPLNGICWFPGGHL